MKTTPPPSSATRQRGVSLWTLALLLSALVAGCAAPAPAARTDEVAFDEAVAAATDNLMAQTQQLPAFMAKLTNRAVVIDPMFDNPSGQQTALTRLLEERVTSRLRGAQFEVLPFQPASLSKAQYLLTGTLTRVLAAKTGARAPFQIDLALTDTKTRNVVAQSSARARDDNLDTTPTPYYRDSPILVKDKVVEGYIRTSATPPGQPADPAYFERVTTAATINEATQLYNNGKYQDAHDLYKTALATPSGEQMRTLNGIYLTSWKLGRNTEAEQAFSKVVEHGIANKNLGVKFLFNPNSTDFWSDPKVSGPYALWLRQIARQSANAKVCMNVVGHTSRTGSETYNDKLSAQRATAIRQKLTTEAPELAPRTKANGVGFRENIIGTGTDDASDALDRRVEFKIVGC
ncbi:MAG TPA: OmpA family protein [Rhizobacter sp.]|nr:OmpA family protein [Rhizobacter sp.]